MQQGLPPAFPAGHVPGSDCGAAGSPRFGRAAVSRVCAKTRLDFPCSIPEEMVSLCRGRQPLCEFHARRRVRPRVIYETERKKQPHERKKV